MIRPADKPLSPTGGVVGLQGQSRARRRDREGRRHEEAAVLAARRAASIREEDASRRSARARYKEGEVLVIRYEGPRGGPGMREMLSTTAALYGQGMGDKVALITDGRFSGAHARLLHRPCRAGGGGRRPDRAARGRRHHRHRRGRGHAVGQARRRRACRAQGEMEAARDRLSKRARSGNTRKGWDRRGTAP